MTRDNSTMLKLMAFRVVATFTSALAATPTARLPTGHHHHHQIPQPTRNVFHDHSVQDGTCSSRLSSPSLTLEYGNISVSAVSAQCQVSIVAPTAPFPLNSLLLVTSYFVYICCCACASSHEQILALFIANKILLIYKLFSPNITKPYTIQRLVIY